MEASLKRQTERGGDSQRGEDREGFETLSPSRPQGEQSPIHQISMDPNQKRRQRPQAHQSIPISQSKDDTDDFAWTRRLNLSASESDSFLHLESQSQLHKTFFQSNHSISNNFFRSFEAGTRTTGVDAQPAIDQSDNYVASLTMGGNFNDIELEQLIDPLEIQSGRDQTDNGGVFLAIQSRSGSVCDASALVEGQRRSSMPCSAPTDGVFSNITARPEIMVLPKGSEDDPPPVIFYQG